MSNLITEPPIDVPRLRTPALVNAAEYWLRPDRFAHRCQPLGDRFLVAMPGWRPWLCLTHPDDIKRVFTADTDVLRLGAALTRGSPHALVLGPTGLTNVDGAEHMRSRRMQLPPFHGEALVKHQAVMERKAQETLERWPYGRATRADAHMQAISLEVIIAVVFGVTDPDRVERLRAATLALMRIASSRRFLLQTIVVTARNKGWDGGFRRVRRATAAIDAIVLEEVAERRRAGDLGQDDVLGMFLRARDEDGMPMPDAELCDAMRTLLLGGHETTASTLAWILERVSRHPAELARLEAAALDGDDDYIDAVVKEAMRLRPVFPITARLASAPFELGDLTIPTGTLVVPHITLVHRRPDLYPDPLAFRPERFLDTRAGTYTWIPFGGGPRRCLGAAFSLIETRIVLRTMLRHAHLVPTRRPSERIARHTVTIVPAHGATITLERRSAAARGC
ncbi:MAG TPA: cytochrome P450 [Conexibacter sp.]|nr:cytochrome P450 [Conexibacter sp.]